MKEVILSGSDEGFDDTCAGVDVSDTFLVVGSPEYFNSARCFLNFEYACEQKKKIVVVIEHGKILPADFQKLLDRHGLKVALYVRGNGESFVEALNRATADLLGVDKCAGTGGAVV